MKDEDIEISLEKLEKSDLENPFFEGWVNYNQFSECRENAKKARCLKYSLQKIFSDIPRYLQFYNPF